MTFLQSLLSVWFRQLLALLLVPGILGALLHLTERATQANLMAVLGWRGIVWWTGWLGTPIHELSHAVVSTVCFHKVHEIKLWEPHPDDGVLGYVRYSLPQNPWLRWFVGVPGQFFSGIAPLFGGALVLLLALRLAIADPQPVLDAARACSDTAAQGAGPEIWRGFLALVRAVYTSVFAQGSANPRPWLFLYAALAVGAHLAPSPTDLKGGLLGLSLLLLAGLVADAIAILAGASPLAAVGPLARVAAAVSSVLVFALVLNVGNLAFAFALRVAFAWRRPRG